MPYCFLPDWFADWMPWKWKPSDGAVMRNEDVEPNAHPPCCYVKDSMKGITMKIEKLIVSSLLLFGAVMAHALEINPYSAVALAEAQQADKPVALHFHADWCPTCRAQDKVLQSLKSEQGLKLTVLVANYDTEKDLKRRFKVNAQSTLVVLKGKKEAARLVGDTSSEGIRNALKSAL